jgi:hypothetical protein
MDEVSDSDGSLGGMIAAEATVAGKLMRGGL